MKRIFLIIFLLIILYGCKHELERPSWNVELLSPLATSNLTISNLFSNDSISTININDSGLVSLVFEEDFLDINFDTLIKLELRANEESTTLDSITFEDVSIIDSITTGELIIELFGPQWGPALFPDGSLRPIPQISGIPIDTTNIDASEYFETMNLWKGYLIVDIYNGLPSAISNINGEIININNLNLIGNLNFPYIGSKEKESDTISIGGMILEENMQAIIHNLDLEGTNGDSVVIKYNDGIIITVTISDIGVTEATAIFPEQQISETLKEHSFDMGDARLEEVKLKTGLVTINAISTLPDAGKIIYNIPSLKKNGISFESINIIPPSINGEITIITHNLDGYSLDLRGEEGRIGGDTVNTIYTEFLAFIDSSGELVTINQTDSFYSYIDFDLVPEYGRGYLGQDTINIQEEIDITNFNKVLSLEKFDLKKASISLRIKNYLGADAKLIFNNLATSNETTIATVTKDQYDENVLGKSYNIMRATETNSSPPINPINYEIILKADNMIEIIPNKLISDVDFYINPNGPQTTTDFLYPDFPITAGLNIEIPLELIAKNLILIDTSIVNFEINNETEIEKIFINIQNGLPLECNLKLILIDENDNILDTLFNDNTFIPSAILDNNLNVIEPVKSTFEEDFINLENTSKIITIASFSTANLNEYVKIYNDYAIDITLSAKFKKKIGE